jgi:seryl-tRNA synthetase
VFGKEKGGYARGVGNGVTYNRYFNLPRTRKETDARIELLQTQLDNKRSERKKISNAQELSTEMSQKDDQVKQLSAEMADTKEMVSKMLSILSSQGINLDMPCQFPLDSDVSHFLCC